MKKISSIYKLNRIVPLHFFYRRYQGRKKIIELTWFPIVYIERVCKRWSTNDVSFHFATRCVSSQTEITHGNALFFRFPIFTAIRELIRYMLERSVEAMLLLFTRIRQSSRSNRQMNQSPNIRFVFLLISLFVGRAAKTYERNRKTRERIPSERRHYRRRRIYLEGIQIYTKRLHSVQPFPHAIHNPTTLAQHGAPFTPVLLLTVTDEPQCVRRIPHCGTLPARFAM